MHSSIRRAARTGRLTTFAVLGVALLGACADETQPLGSRDEAVKLPAATLQVLECTASAAGVTCATAGPRLGGASGAIIPGKQGDFVRLASSNAGYNPATELFSVDVTVQNLMNEAIGTPDGVTPGTQGIRVFFMQEPYATSGAGEVTVVNADGTDFFTGANQPFHRYSEILDKNEVSGSKTWQFSKPSQVTTFSFKVVVEADIQYLLVINEVLVNPANYNANPDANGEWFELYNAGTQPVDLENLVITDSAQSGRRSYHRISSSVVVAPGTYVVLGNTTNTTNNGGVPVDYAYGNALQLANNLDAIKIARVYGTDTLTVDRTQYAAAGTSAVDGVSRELTNPARDNSNMDGSNWGSASVTAVYGPGGRGTPKAQNSVYEP